jgi:hypothetical protein
MKPDPSPDSLAIPAALLAELQAQAEQEHRPAGDVLQDAVESYVRNKRWQTTLAYGQERAKALGLTEEDVPRLIAEYRQEKRQDRA